MSYLGQVQVGNTHYIVATFVATAIAPTADSSAVTFTVRDPAGTEVPTSSPNGAITGPTLTTLADGRHQSVWTLARVAATVPGVYVVRARSTAGLVASDDSTFEVVAYAPLTTA